MNKKIFLSLIILILTINTANALQQTVGELKTNITPGDSVPLHYKIYNEENTSVNVSFNIEGHVSFYTSVVNNTTLKPYEYCVVNLTVSIPQDYTGNKLINGTIYALKEGSSGGQVQLNIRLGKNIKVYVDKPTIIKEPVKIVSKQSGYGSFIMVIGTFIIMCALIKYKIIRRNK